MRRRLALAVILIVCAHLDAQSTWYVATSGSVSGTGTIASPFASIQQAINAAQSGDNVLVTQGTYFENLNFLGKDIVVASTDGPQVTVIDGSSQGPVAIFINGETPASRLEGFKLTHGLGNLPLNGLFACGGGIHIWNSSPTIDHCIITQNVGGATANFTLAGTGGVEIVNSHATLSFCRISQNTGGVGSNGGAGGIRISGLSSAPAIADCVIVGNVAAQAMAGGIQISGGQGTIDRTRIEGNTGGFAGAGGIGIVGTQTAPTIRDTIIQSNTGGVGNVPPFFSANASGAGGIQVSSGQPTLVHCTIAFNQTTGLTTTMAGGLHIASANSAGSIKNSIIWANFASNAASAAISTPATTTFIVQYTDVEGGFAGLGNIDVDPVFISANDAHLGDASPCINAAAPMTEGPADVDGDPRVFYGTADLGADEYVGAALSGNLGATIGGPFDYLFVNGSTGGIAHRVQVLPSTPIQVSVLQPPFNPIPSTFIIWGYIGTPTFSDIYPTPIGSLAFTPFHVDPLRPGLFCLANNIFPDPDAKVGSSPAPWAAIVGYLPYPYVFTIQALLVDYTSPSTDFGFTNAIIVESLAP